MTGFLRIRTNPTAAPGAGKHIELLRDSPDYGQWPSVWGRALGTGMNEWPCPRSLSHPAGVMKDVETRGGPGQSGGKGVTVGVLTGDPSPRDKDRAEVREEEQGHRKARHAGTSRSWERQEAFPHTPGPPLQAVPR